MKKKTLYILSALLVLLLVLFFVANIVIKSKIETSLKNDLPATISLSYKNISVNLLGRNVAISQVELEMKEEAMQLNFAELKLNNLHLFKLLFSDTIYIEECKLKNPKLSIDASQKTSKEEEKKSNQKNKILFIEEFSITNAAIILKSKDGKKATSFEKSSAIIENILIETNPKKEKPISHKISSFKVENLFHQIDDGQFLTIKKITSEENNVIAENLIIDFVKNKAIQMQYIKQGNDLLSLSVAKLELNEYTYTYKDLFSLKAKKASILNPDFTIYNHLYSQNVNVKRKPLYSERLRNMNLGFDVQKVIVQNAKIAYEEHDQLANLPGKISLSKINATVKNFKNKDSINDLISVDASFNFMDVAPSKVNWTIRMYNPKDAFTFKGNINNLDAERLNLFTVNTINVKSEGKIDAVYFNFKGNDYNATGTMDLDYKNFKVLLVKEKSKKERKFLNAIVNIFTKREDKNKDKKASVFTVVRDQNASFFNFVWLCLKEGLLINMTAIKNGEN